MFDKIVLASSSKSRFFLIKNAGFKKFSIQHPKINESHIKKNSSYLSPNQLARKISEEKARDVSLRFQDSLVIGCDQILSFEGKILNKPKNMEDAHNRLLSFSGKTHYLYSGVSIFKSGQWIWSHTEQAKMKVRILDSEFIKEYLIRSGKDILQTVGSYQIEKEGVQIFDEIEGDYFTIVGLPILPLILTLRKLKVNHEKH